jgi:hypothetical protein
MADDDDEQPFIDVSLEIAALWETQPESFVTRFDQPLTRPSPLTPWPDSDDDSPAPMQFDELSNAVALYLEHGRPYGADDSYPYSDVLPAYEELFEDNPDALTVYAPAIEGMSPDVSKHIAAYVGKSTTCRDRFHDVVADDGFDEDYNRARNQLLMLVLKISNMKISPIVFLGQPSEEALVKQIDQEIEECLEETGFASTEGETAAFTLWRHCHGVFKK